MQYATLRYTNIPVPNHPPRRRRNTMEPSGRQHQMIQLVKASQQQQYAHEYIDDRGSFLRAQKAEDERIQQDIERAQRAQRRNRARKQARASKAAEQVVNSTYEEWPVGGNIQHPIVVPCSPRAGTTNGSIEKARLRDFKFPKLDTRPQTRPPPIKFPGADQCASPIASPTKRLAPLSRFNPFVRARSESLSSLIEDEAPAVQPVKRKRNASVSALFARIHCEAEYMRRRQGYH